MRSAKFHFQEVDWIIYFPSSGNKGRTYPKYGVAYRDRTTGESQPGVRINLESVLSKHEIRDNYPHTVIYFAEAFGKGKNYSPQKIVTRTVANQQELFRFLEEIGI